MRAELLLRPAREDDAEPLYAWRQDPQTRAASHSNGPQDPESHRRWLDAVLADSRRRLYVAELDGERVGTVRADLDEDGRTYLLSWTVAPLARGRGIGRRMVCMLVDMLEAPVRAEIRADNLASIRIAEAAGLSFQREIAGVRNYRSG